MRWLAIFALIVLTACGGAGNSSSQQGTSVIDQPKEKTQ